MAMLRPALALVVGMLMTSAAAAAAGPEPAQPLFAVIYRPGPAWKPGLPMTRQDLRAHGGYYAKLVAEGRVVAGGGFVGADGGLAVWRCADAEEAGRLLAADPAIANGVFVGEMHRWQPRFGVDDDLVPRRPQPGRPMPEG